MALSIVPHIYYTMVWFCASRSLQRANTHADVVVAMLYES